MNALATDTLSQKELELIRDSIRPVQDFPHKGILFRDITTLLADPVAFDRVQKCLIDRYQDMNIDAIAGIESRGFIFGMPLAHQLKKPFVPIRKPGKLPRKTFAVDYALEYGEATLEVHQDALQPGHRVLLVDDLLATGGTLKAASILVQQTGASLIEAACIIELLGLNGREQCDFPVYTLVAFD